MTSVTCNDASFGPVSTCRFFDFTLTFQNAIIIIPSALIIALSLVEVPLLAKRPILVQQRKSLFRNRSLRHIDETIIVRCSLAGIHATISLSLLLLVVFDQRLHSILESSTIVAALSISTLSAALLVPYSFLARLKLGNGSFLIPLYLFSACLIDACRIRTYLGVPELRNTSYMHLSIAMVAGKGMMLLAENTSGIQTMHSTKEGSASFISIMLFWWLKNVIWTGFRRPLEMVNLDNLSPDFEGRMLGARLFKEWKRQTRQMFSKRGSRIGIVDRLQSLLRFLRSLFKINRDVGSDSIEMDHLNAQDVDEDEQNSRFSQSSKGPSLLWVCFRAFPVTLITPVLPRIAMSGITLALPFLVSKTLAFAESNTEASTAQPVTYGWGLVGAYGFVYLVLSFSTGQFYWACDKGQIKLRGALLDMIYRKSLRLHLSAARTTGGGAAANLMAVDLERFVRAIIPFHSLWSGLLVVIVATYLLYLQLGWTFLATLVSIIICLLFPIVASRGIGGKQARWSKATDTRVNLTSSAVSNAKGVKFMAYENIIIQRLIEEREDEIRHGWKYYKQLILVAGFTNIVTEIMAITTFTTLAIVDYVSGTQRLNVTLVVTTLTLMQLLESPLLQMGQNYSSIIAALVSLRRIQEFLVKEETPVNVISQSSRTSSIAESTVNSGRDAKSRSDSLPGNIAASFQSASIGWSCSRPVLININLNIPVGQLTMVCGTLASGKSTLLQALLGETNVTSGTLHLPMKRSPIAYVAQEGWLQEGATIRDNIIFDAPFDTERYQSVVNATALHVDFNELPHRDQSLAKALSGGQRQRVTLARAIYANAASYVLDDFTSALDAETASHVWSCLFTSSKGLLRGKTVVMATNALQLLKDASLIVRLDNGQIVESGTYEGLSERGIEAVGRQSNEVDPSRPEVETPISTTTTAATTTAVGAKEEKEDDKHEEVERGSVKWSVYLDWFKAIGFVFMTITFVSNFAHTGALLGWSTYLQYWGRDSQVDPMHKHTLHWLAGFIALILASIGSFAFEFATLAYAALNRAGKSLHTAELKGVFGTSLSFFEDNASGRIINRFSQDLFVLDWEIILALGNFLGSISLLFGSLLLLIIPVPYLTIVVLGAALLYIGIQRLYAPASRQLRRLEMATKSPIYTLFSETSTPSGLATIRGLSRQELFIDTNIGRLNRSQQPYFYLQAIRRWLQTWMNILALIINVALIAIVVILRNTKSIGVLGAGLVQATQISMLLNQSLISYTELEIASVALERVLDFAKLPKEQSDAVNGKMRVKVESQDVKGQIEFRDVSVSYRAGLKPSLRNLSLTIKPGEKLGICGRSGSGKSTLLLAIFAMLDTNQGEIYLDNQAISSMSAFSLRNSLTIVPQSALILTATVRDNLDPERKKPDSELWNALETCKLLNVVKTFPDGLDTRLANDINLSAGQRQLFSMARALLRNRKVLVLDEATSSMDYETDAAVQHILRTQFNHCTIITVAHRIATVRDYDRILVLSNGQMVELDTPDTLMKQPTSIFRALAIEQGVN